MMRTILTDAEVSKIDLECYYGRHNFINGACTRKGCIVEQANVIYITARRWFARTYGNTYHSVYVVMPNGARLDALLVYGYGEQYKQTAAQLIARHLGVEAPNTSDNLNALLVAHGYYAVISAADVQRKKDL